MKKLLPLLFLPFLFSCKNSSNSPLFRLVSAEDSGVNFNNLVEENEELNLLKYQYMYNGGGVAVGDVNGDGLADVFFSGNMVENKLYLNKGKQGNSPFSFEDITEKAGVKGRKKWKTGVSMIDINADGKLDIYVCYSGPGTDEERKNELYINNGLVNGVPTFTESAEKYGLDASGTYTTQVAFFDMDKDGDLDCFMANHADMFYNAFFNTERLRNTRHPKYGNRLYRNDEGYFHEISVEAGVHGSGLNFGLSVSVGDLNQDNWPDLYVANDYNEQDFLYINQQNGTFKEVLKQSMGHISKNSMGTGIVDFNNDELADIVSLDMLPESNYRQKLLKGPDEYDTYQLLVDSGFYHQNTRNMLQINQGLSNKGVPIFSEVGQMAGVSNTDWSWSPLAGDFDNDGRKDLLVTNGFLRDFTNMDFLKYTYQEEINKAQNSGQQLNTWQLIQQMPSTKTSNYVFRNISQNQFAQFEDATKSWGLEEPTVSTGAAYADLDNDGDLDLIINNTNQVAQIYENQHSPEQSHYLKIQLRGNAPNTTGIGAKVVVKTNDQTQMQELYPAQGFQSSVEPILHFGLGQNTKIESVEIYWSSGKKSILSNQQANQTLQVVEATAKEGLYQYPQTAALFEDITQQSQFSFEHKTIPYVDFKHQALLPYQLSKVGPFTATADVNGDGLEDVFVGGNSQQGGVFLMQQVNGTFKPASSQPWQQQSVYQDMGMTFFDADGDHDLDLFIARGSAAFGAVPEASQDVLFINDGKGTFSLNANALPNMQSNGSCVSAGDFDKDGDMDLFVGGRSIPNRYPEADQSYLLKNESKGSIVKFTPVQTESLASLGIVTTSVWHDINQDGWIDLIVAGELMPITILENQKGKLVDKTEAYHLEKSHGMWSKIQLEDMDNDGDMDLIAGNAGLNSQLKADKQEPLTITYADFDQNETIDPMICYFIQGKSYPMASLDETATQMPWIRKKFLKYHDYAQAGLSDLFTSEQLDKAKTKSVYTLATTYFENTGKGIFKAQALPSFAQTSWVSGISSGDFNKDGKKDILLSGNFHPWRVQLGKMDASHGVLLLGNGKGNFQASKPQQTGLLFTGDIRDMKAILIRNKPSFIFTRNQDKAGIVQLK